MVFVVRSMGDVRFSAINIAYLVVSLIQSIGTAIGMGGSVLWTIKKGKEAPEVAGKYVCGTLFLLLLASAVSTVSIIFLTEPLLRLFGSEREILISGKEYLDVIVLGAAFQIFAKGIVPIICNNRSAFFALVIMMSGFLSNILLDYLFVWVMDIGTEGAAVATIIGQLVTTLEALIYRKLPIIGSPSGFGCMARNIGKVGIAPLGLTLSPIVSLMLINRFSMLNRGEEAVARYACIAYALTLVQMPMQGVGDGSQPLMSQYDGEGKIFQLLQTRKIACAVAVGLAVTCNILLFFVRSELGELFGASESTGALVAEVYRYFYLDLYFMPFPE